MPKFVPRQRKHKVLARQKEAAERQHHGDEEHPGDSNASEIVPSPKAEKELQRLKAKEVFLSQHPKVSSKKKKRLNHYIDTKLRKEENLDLIKKLAATQVDTSLFQSSRRLGNADQSKRHVSDQVRKEHAGESVAGLHVPSHREADSPVSSEDDEAEADEDSDTELVAPLPSSYGSLDALPEDDKVREQSRPVPGSTPLTFGGGLKRPLAVDADGRPVIPKRQRVVPSAREGSFGPSKGALGHILQDALSPVKEPDSDWEGFSDNNTDEDRSPEPAAESSEDEDEEEDDDDDGEGHASRISGFKAWAVQRRNEAIGFISSADAITELPNISYTPRAPDFEPLPPELEVPNTNAAPRLVHTVHVERSPSIQEARSALPVVAEEQKIMEAIHNNDVVVVCGATGSGKTTQVPQFLFEAGYGDPNGPTPGIIGVTQPRRVAAVSMAERVGQELGQHKARVAYQIRFDHSTVKRDTAIKFMTDGILLREITQDLSLSKYSAIIVDEAHERSVNTDILIGMLSRIVFNVRAENAQRDRSMKPLKLIVMSATMRISDFLDNPRLFPRGVPPLVEAEGRQFPVTVHFSRQTHRDYVEEAFTKVSRGHRKLPPGGMLVFLTGQNEIVALQKRFREAFPNHGEPVVESCAMSTMEAPIEAEDMVIGAQKYLNEDASDDEDVITGLDEDGIVDQEDEFQIGQTEEEARQSATLKLHVLPLYSQLPTKEQLRIFQPPPDGSRLIVLATNVAETSLTIPGIRYVFDCGRAKEKKHDPRSGVQSFEIDWISKASASQRAGRAGRTGPGHCYRFYSSALYEAYFPEHSEPEILRTSMEDVVLQLKSMGLANVVNFPFPTPPDQGSLAQAERLLQSLGALTKDGKVTSLGRRLSNFPVSPRFSRMLVVAQERGCLPLVVALVAALAVPEVFVPQSQAERPDDDNDDDEDEDRGARLKAYNAAHGQLSSLDPSADAIKLFSALCAYSWESHANNGDDMALHDFCSKYFLRPKAMKEANQLRRQLSTIAERNAPGSVGPFSLKVPTPTDAELHLLRTITAAGFVDQVAIRADLAPVPPELGRKPSKAIDIPYMTLFTDRSHGREAGDGLVYLHPTSVLAHRSKAKLPQYVIYSHLQRSSTGKVRMASLTPVSGAQLATLARDTPRLELGKPIGKVDVEGQDVRVCDCLASLVGDRGSTPWPLRTWKVRQKRVVGKGWVVQDILG